MGGKTGTTTQQSSVSIPPEVLARYNSVNARAESTADQQFTPYGGQFVAPLTGTQQAGISNINQAQGMATPYYNAAGEAMAGGYQATQPYYGAATSSVQGGQQNANILQGEAYGNINQAYAGAQPYQQAATYGIEQAYAGAQPYQGVATGLGLSGANAVNPDALTAQNINQYMSPYLGSVVGTTMANLRQQQAEEQSKILGNQITSGAFGGDRGRIAQANLARQQELATGQTVAGLMNQGYGQALTTAQQQQAQQLAAEQANRAARATTAQQLAAIGQQGFAQGATTAQQKASLGQQAFGQGTEAAKAYQGLGQGLYGMGQEYGKNVAGLGTQAFDTALKGAQAQIGAGTLEQQTQQAQNTADYNQFLQQQGYPFQVAQFLANIAMGTGALSGSSQQGTTTSPQSFFSDRRLKDDVEKIGKTFDGQDIVRYKYKGEPGTRIGLIAQDVEKHHPDAVGLAGGYRTVDYDKATDDAAKRGHFADGGLAGGYSSEGGAVMPEMAGMGFAAGGAPDINSMMAEILNAHQGMYPYGKAGMYGQTSGRAGAYGTSQMQPSSRNIMRVDASRFAPASQQLGAAGQAMQGLNTAERIGSAYTSGSNALFGSEPTTANPQGGRGAVGRGGNYNPGEGALAQAGRWVQRQFEPSQPPATTTPPRREEAPVQRPDENAQPEATVVEAPAITGGTNAAGGLVRGHYAMGGLPFSEAGGYIPEGVLNDNEAEKNKKAMDSFAPKSPGSGQSGSGSGPGLIGGLSQIGGAIKGAETIGSAASSAGQGIGELMMMLPMLAARGGAIERRGYALNGEVVDARQDGLAAAAPPVDPSAAPGGLTPQEARDYSDIVRQRESGGRPNARNPRSSAGGPHQFINGTWGDFTAAHPSLFQGMTPEQVSAARNDEVMSRRASDWYAGQNAPVLRTAGYAVTPSTLALAHRFGGSGASSLLGAAPDASVESVVGPKVMRANPELRNMTVAQLRERFDSDYRNARLPAGLDGTAQVASAQRAGLAGAASNDGSGAPDPNGNGGIDQTTDRAEERLRRSGVNFTYPRERSEPNWLQRHQDWLVPVLSGLGAMASSPSRYLGSALLQGLAGGAQQYASMQNKAEEQQLSRGQLEVSQQQARTAAVAEETASQTAAQRVLDAFDRRYRQILRPDGSTAFIDQTGGGTLTAEQHAQQRATLFNALLTGNRGVSALSAGQARPTTEGAVAAPAGGTTPQAAPAGGAATPMPPAREGTQPAAASGASPAAVRPAAATTAGATGAQPVDTAPPANPQEAAELAQANRFLEPLVSRLNDVLHRIEIAENQRGIEGVPADLTRRRDDLEKQILELRTGKTSIPDPTGRLPNNEFFVNQRIARDVQRAREEALARAEAENEFAPYIDPATGTLVQPTRRRAPPSGGSTPAPQGAAQQPAAAANEQRPATATVAPATAAVTTALPTPPPGGGSPIPQNLPPGTQIRELSRPAQQAIERDTDMNSYLTSGPVMDEAIKRYHSMARALQLFQSGRTSEMTGFVAAYAADLGMPDIANAINRGQVDAQQWLGKEGLNAALQQLAAINSRFTQAEFSRVQSSGMPSITNTPQANYQMLTNGLSSLYRLRQFQTDWQVAQQQGWNSPSAFYDAWSRANPSEAFTTAAERRVGNIRGMQLPQDAQRNWVPGQTYVMPDNAPPAVQRAFANVRPGQVFRFNGLDSETPYTVLNRAQAYSTGTQ